MSQFFIPWNHQPVTTGVETTSYTVPAGRFARVTCSHSVNTYFSVADTQGVITALDVVAGNVNHTFSIWAMAGDVITFTTATPVSGTVTLTATGAGTFFDIDSNYSQIQWTHNGNGFCLQRAWSNISVAATFSGAGNITVGDFLGDINADIYYEEYLNIS